MATIDGRTLDHKTLTHIRTQAVRRVVEDGKHPMWKAWEAGCNCIGCPRMHRT